MLLKMFCSCPRRNTMATMTAIAMTAMMRAYSTRPCPSSSRTNVNTVLPSLPLVRSPRKSCACALATRHGKSVLGPRKCGLNCAIKRGSDVGDDDACRGHDREGRLVDPRPRDPHRLPRHPHPVLDRELDHLG